MANEIWCSWDSASTLYAFVIRKTDDFIWDVGDSAFEAIGTWNDARAGECDIAMSATAGDFHTVDFPSGITAAGVYRVEIRERAGGSPDTDDVPIAQGELHWDGSAEIDITAIDTLIDTLISATETVKNVYGVGE